jgi:tetratricopeptide (TPR) repeat protein
MIKPNTLFDKSNLILILSLLIALICYIYVFDKKLSLNGDNVTYYLLGKSIASGHGYSEIWTSENKPHTQYPPGYPAIMSIIMRFLPENELTNIVVLKILNGFLFFGTIVLLFLMLKKFGINKWFFPAILIPVATNPHLLDFSRIMMSEIPFLFFTMAALYAIIKVDLSNPPYRERAFYIAVILLATSIFIRTQGIALLIGAVLYFLFKRKYLYAIWITAATVVVILPWIVRVQMQGGSPYLQQLLLVDPYNPDAGSVSTVQLLGRFFTNVKRYISVEMPIVFFPVAEKKIAAFRPLGWLIGIIIASLFIYGIRGIKNYRTLVAGSLIGTFGIILFWPTKWFGVRFIIGIVPLLWLLTISGLLCFISALLEKKNIKAKTVPVWFTMIFLFNLPMVQQLHREAQKPYPPNWRNYFRIADWVRNNTAPETVVSCRKSSFFYLFSRRPTCCYLFSEDNIKLITDLVKQSVDYVVVDQLGYRSTLRYLIPAINQNPTFFKKAIHYENPGTYLFETLGTFADGSKREIAGASFLVMALNRFNMEDYDSTEHLLNLAMETTKKNVGESNKVYANAVNNLGIVTFMKGNYPNARKLFERSMSIEKVILGKEHPDIANSLVNIGETYKAEGDYAQAESLYLQALSIMKKAYGPNNRDIARLYCNLIKFYSTWGKQNEADEAFKGMVSAVENAARTNRSEFLEVLMDAHRFYH